MFTLKQKFAAIPSGSAALFFIQIFATLGFAVLYSTLVLYATSKLHFSIKEATAIMGVFGAFNYGLHLFGGYLGGRLISNRNLFIGGMLLQVLGCACISGGSVAQLYWGLALFLTGSGLNVTCINMMLTQRFAPEDERRESAFLWNYAGMNLGFFIGFSAAGYYQLEQDYASLFIFATLGNFVAIVLAALNWNTLADRNTPLSALKPAQFRKNLALGLAVLIGLVPVVFYLLHQAESTEQIILWIGGAVGLALAALTLLHRERRERRNMTAYLMLTLGSLVFWTLYQMAPTGLQLFADKNVDRLVWGVEIAPQWIQNINAFVIMIGGPLLAIWFKHLRARAWKLDVPLQFALALLLIGGGFLVLPLGIWLAPADGMVAFKWLFISYILQSLGELLISPVGYAMIGRLAPTKYQGVMMGTWMLVTGEASILASYFSGMVPDPAAGGAVSSNPVYSQVFGMLGWGSVGVGLLLVVLIPFLRTLISSGPSDEATA
ncbi:MULTISPECIES: oligopeptide:H+ symporter [unclassified Undibacterium]|uniref:peptide MFS transporter n=1 Tax=unclassified Undibacterium TaxID=2630295 RepID=UPI002AC8FD69|nr:MULTISPECIES: oligopeptide:H+ symporter [unclassified Undibacterium]MEB0138964.1 oligopeptide:H+ symporter [Undibacterium sp. CCC2.1]MEB0171941.1 oligopeptide:H+ symporter [Undibacterium sp. CCC1.1]MEB0175882.1 oligopeptide:H+ symporter [Undibacterium sp. CCC3.4]MEB0215052.1 oligopeptide:H+ symporter [Undibacterium sp. 5I2]WPX45024.1 oligopeptide:H+ symporter [Undibacterium sp. CCC3.4]